MSRKLTWMNVLFKLSPITCWRKLWLRKHVFILSNELKNRAKFDIRPSVQLLSHVQLLAIPWTAARLPYPSPTPGAYSNSCPASQQCHPTISSSVIPLSSCHQSFPASGSFPMSQVFTSGGQSIGVSDSASVLLMNVQDWFPLGLTSLQSKGLWRVFSNTTVQKHQFFSTQKILWV